MSTTGRLWPKGERTGDPHALGEPFLDEGLGERARPGAVADERELVGRQQPGRLDDVGDELCQRIDLERTLELSRRAFLRSRSAHRKLFATWVAARVPYLE